MASNTTNNLTVHVELASGVPAATIRHFVTYETSNPSFREVKTLVPGANGAFAVGVLAEDIDTTLPDGHYASSMVIPGGLTEIILGEDVTQGAPLRVGGNSTEVDGTAYLANAAGDFIVGYAVEAGSAGDIITFNFVGNAGLVPA